jgi:hypothetical protein
MNARTAVVRKSLCAFAAMGVVFGLGHVAHADDLVQSRGEIGGESRAFWPDSHSASRDWNTATVGRLYLDAAKEKVSARARLFSRLDTNDRDRSVFIAEEAFAEVDLRPVRLRAGFQMLNWTATEAFHPADVLNSRYYDSAIENPEKLGEPMLSARVEIPNGNVEAYFMPFFVRPIFPTGRSRFNLGAPGTSLGGAMLLKRDGSVDSSLDSTSFVPQWAARVQQTIGQADLSLHILQQQDRATPVIVFDRGPGTARPLFAPVTQIGATAQQVVGAAVLKLEMAYRWFYRPESKSTAFGPLIERNHFVAAAGIDYNVPAESGGESTLLLEGQVFIPKQHDLPRELNPLFQHDVVAGWRYAFNDESSRSLIALVIVDVVRPQEFFFNLGYTQRLGETWGLNAGLRLVRVPPRNAAMPVLYENLNNAHQANLNLLRYF